MFTAALSARIPPGASSKELQNENFRSAAIFSFVRFVGQCSTAC